MSATRGGSWLERAGAFGRKVEDAVLIVGLAALILLASGQILLRNVFSIGLVWADGTLRLIVLWLALLGAMAASRENRHIAINLADRVLPPKLQRVAAAVRSLFAALVCGALAWYALVFVRDSREFGDRLLGDWPAWWFQIIMPVAFTVIAFRYLVRAVASLRRPA